MENSCCPQDRPVPASDVVPVSMCTAEILLQDRGNGSSCKTQGQKILLGLLS